MSTNKVYGDYVNNLHYKKFKYRYSINYQKYPHYKNGFDEKIPIDQSMHSPFGVSKTSSDLMVQEYGRYFNLKTVCLRAGCLTGENHLGAELHGFLSYLFKCAYYGKKYKVIGYGGRQVRDNLNASDVSKIFYEIYKNPPDPGEVFNIGGGRDSSISILEAINKIQNLLEKEINYKIYKNNRKGDHIYWVSDMTKFEKKYPSWKKSLLIDDTLLKMYEYERAKSTYKV